jgi:hypothetical protein
MGHELGKEVRQNDCKLTKRQSHVPPCNYPLKSAWSVQMPRTLCPTRRKEVSIAPSTHPEDRGFKRPTCKGREPKREGKRRIRGRKQPLTFSNHSTVTLRCGLFTSLITALCMRPATLVPIMTSWGIDTVGSLDLHVHAHHHCIHDRGVARVRELVMTAVAELRDRQRRGGRGWRLVCKQTGQSRGRATGETLGEGSEKCTSEIVSPDHTSISGTQIRAGNPPRKQSDKVPPPRGLMFGIVVPARLWQPSLSLSATGGIEK